MKGPNKLQASRPYLRFTYPLFAAALWVGCDSAAGPETESTVSAEPAAVQGLWGGLEQDGNTARMFCLMILEPENTATVELVEVDTLAGTGFASRSAGTWSYEHPRVDVDLEAWPDPRGIPRIEGELSELGSVMLLRVAYRQGDRFALGLQRVSRCGRSVY